MDCLSSCASESSDVTSPCRRTCVCVSARPGSTVAFVRSITSTPGGATPPGVTDTILSPSTRISAFATGVSLLPSIRRPALIAIFFGDAACCCAVTATAESQTRPIEAIIARRIKKPPRRRKEEHRARRPMHERGSGGVARRLGIQRFRKRLLALATRPVNLRGGESRIRVSRGRRSRRLVLAQIERAILAGHVFLEEFVPVQVEGQAEKALDLTLAFGSHFQASLGQLGEFAVKCDFGNQIVRQPHRLRLLRTEEFARKSDALGAAEAGVTREPKNTGAGNQALLHRGERELRVLSDEAKVGSHRHLQAARCSICGWRRSPGVPTAQSRGRPVRRRETIAGKGPRWRALSGPCPYKRRGQLRRSRQV